MSAIFMPEEGYRLYIDLNGRNLALPARAIVTPDYRQSSEELPRHMIIVADGVVLGSLYIPKAPAP